MASINSFKLAPVIRLTKNHQLGTNKNRNPIVTAQATASMETMLPKKTNIAIIAIENKFQ